MRSRAIWNSQKPPSRAAPAGAPPRSIERLLPPEWTASGTLMAPALPKADLAAASISSRSLPTTWVTPLITACGV